MAKRVRRSTLMLVPVAMLHKELKRRERKALTLQRKRDRLAEKLRTLDEKIQEAGGTQIIARRGRVGAIPGRARQQNAMNLADSLAKLLKGKTMGVTEASIAVQKSGYKTGAANFRTIVNQTLIKNKGLFKKVERGQYTAG